MDLIFIAFNFPQISVFFLKFLEILEIYFFRKMAGLGAREPISGLGKSFSIDLNGQSQVPYGQNEVPYQKYRQKINNVLFFFYVESVFRVVWGCPGQVLDYLYEKK